MNFLPAATFGFSIFSIFLILVSPSRSQARFYLSALILTLALPHLLHFFLGPHWKWPHALKLTVSVLFLYYGPLLYLFIRSLVNRHLSWKTTDILHYLAPFLVFPLSSLVHMIAAHAEQVIVPPALNLIQLFSLLLYSFVSYQKIDDFLPDPLIESGSRLRVQGHSLKVTILIFVISWSIQALIEFIPAFRGFGLHIRGALIFISTLSVCYIGILYFSANRGPFPGDPIPQNPENPNSPTGLNSVSPVGNQEFSLDSHQTEEDGIVSTKYLRSGLKPEDAARLMEEIAIIMENEKPYLDTDFSPSYLSRKLNTPVAYISQAINQECNTNFYGFVNGYRVRTVVSELELKKDQPVNLLHLALNAGFNSKSTFNQAFKKMTGSTPSDYKKQLTSG